MAFTASRLLKKSICVVLGSSGILTYYPGTLRFPRSLRPSSWSFLSSLYTGRVFQRLAKELILPVALLLMLCAVSGRVDSSAHAMASGHGFAAEPAASAGTLEEARSELSRIQARQQAQEARVADILADEQRLGELVRQLKAQPPGLSDALRTLRLDRTLRQLRDRLVELQAIRREQRDLTEQERIAREQVGALLRVEAGRRLADAEQAYTSGREPEANTLYRQSLELMQEGERITHAPVTTTGRQRYEFNPELTGSEEPAELAQISVLLRHEAEELEQGLKTLHQQAQQIQADLAFERRAARFQSIRNRDEDGTGGEGAGGLNGEAQAAPTRERELERQLAAIRDQISHDHARMRYLQDRAKELDAIAAGRERQSERRGQ
jgi:hypothetical protein